MKPGDLVLWAFPGGEGYLYEQPKDNGRLIIVEPNSLLIVLQVQEESAQFLAQDGTSGWSSWTPYRVINEDW